MVTGLLRQLCAPPGMKVTSGWQPSLPLGRGGFGLLKTLNPHLLGFIGFSVPKHLSLENVSQSLSGRNTAFVWPRPFKAYVAARVASVRLDVARPCVLQLCSEPVSKQQHRGVRRLGTSRTLSMHPGSIYGGFRV